MARMIGGMFPQPAHTDPATQSEPEDSVTSDTTGKSCHTDIDTWYFIVNIMVLQCCGHPSLSVQFLHCHLPLGSVLHQPIYRLYSRRQKKQLRTSGGNQQSRETMHNMAFPSLVS